MSVVYSEKFKKAVDYVLANEGGYVFDKNDPGGETKWGISKRSYPRLNIRALSVDEAKKIYYCDYWLKGKFEQIPDKNIATQVFDLSVNLGIRPATIVLQRALRAAGRKFKKTVYWALRRFLRRFFLNHRFYWRRLSRKQPDTTEFLRFKSPILNNFLTVG